MNVHREFDDCVENLSKQIAIETGMVKNKTQAMRLMAKTFNGKMVFRKNRFDFKVF